MLMRSLVVTLLVAFFSIHCYAQCTTPDRCIAPEVCCADKINGELCYRPGISHDCVASTTGGFLLCPPGWLGCGNQCYLASLHQCVNDILVPVGPSTPAPPTTCPADFRCLAGESCCLDRTKGPQCFRPGISHDCVASSAGGFLMCPPGWLGCGNQCYLASLHQCVNDILVPVGPSTPAPPTTCPANFPCLAGESCCLDRTKGPQCFRPGISHDCVASSTGGFLMCPPGWLGCGNQCYLASLHQCVNDILVPVGPSTPAPPTTCPADFRCLAGESCCLDRTKGPQCFRPGISHDCVASSAGGFLMCPPGWLGCGNQCYLASLHQCVNHILVPITSTATPSPPPPPSTTCPATFSCLPGELCCQDKFKGPQCYAPATFDCVPSSSGGNILCPQNYLVCADKLNGEQCYLPGVSHDCVASTTGGFLLCPPGWLACANQCYLSSQHQCVNNVLIPIQTPSIPPTTCPANFACLAGESCCVDRTKGPQCFRAGISHDCVASSLGGFLLCPPGWLGCGNQCYLASQHQCVNNVLVPI